MNNKIGLNFDNSFSRLSKILMTEINPTPTRSPKLKILNQELANELNLNLNSMNKSEIELFLSGNKIENGSKCIAQAYAGHQFGNFTILGDGRAILIGEHITKDKRRFDIQLKGSGRTPYSRGGDGRATLTSMLREYLISEAMHGLNIPTTRSLSVVSTGEDVQREVVLKGGILTRIASSHIRVGTFQYLSMKGDLNSLKELIDYTLKRHYFNDCIDINPSITLLKSVIAKQISLIINWMRVGFIHGVMNTDNMSIAGETIDYGPCAFMETYDPQTVFSSIDLHGRYSYKNQPIIAHWNISRLAETLIPFLDNSKTKAIEIGKEIIDDYKGLYEKEWYKMMRGKLGFYGEKNEDQRLIKKLLNWMERNKEDYTNTFLHLMNNNMGNNKVYTKKSFVELKKEINNRKNEIKKLHISDYEYNNPSIIPRNYYVEKALLDIRENEDYKSFNELLKIFKEPYVSKENIRKFQKPSGIIFENNYKTFCGT